MQYIMDNLVIELTRECNMSCPHCLRGCSQKCYTTLEIAKAAIDRFDIINSITFTGGEPTLAADVFDEIVDYIIENEKQVFGFYIASNGKHINHKFMTSCCKLYAYIEEVSGFIDECQCVFDISLDQFHDDISKANLNYLKCFKFVSTRGEIDENYVINEGSAYNNGIGMRNLDWSTKFEPMEQDDIETTYELLYVNSRGNIAPLCDFSYDTQDNTLPQCSVLSKDNNEKLFKKYNKML